MTAPAGATGRGDPRGWGASLGRPPADAAAVTSGEAMRLLVLADGSKRIVEEALAAGVAPRAGSRQTAAAEAVRRCAGALARAAGPFETLVAELRGSLGEARPARVTAAQARALETFARCAAAARPPGP